MTNFEIRTKYVQVPNDDLLIDAYLAEPMVETAVPAVIVFQEIFGVNAHIRDVTERIARLGYVAIAPAIYQRLAPGLELGYSADDIQLGRLYKNQTQATELLSDTQATLAYLRSLPTVNPDAISAIGFCFGGHVAYLAATLPDIKATACFYGAGIATMTPGGGSPTLGHTPEIQGTIYLFFGDQDASIPPSEVEQIATTLRHHHIDHRIFRYPADHGFFCDQRGSYQPEAAAEAWQQVQTLFATQLAG